MDNSLSIPDGALVEVTKAAWQGQSTTVMAAGFNGERFIGYLVEEQVSWPDKKTKEEYPAQVFFAWDFFRIVHHNDDIIPDISR